MIQTIKNKTVSTVESYTNIPRTVKGTSLTLFAFLMSTGVAAAEEQQLGSIYCGTGVETLINTIFGAIIALGLPIALFYAIKGALAYTRSGGNPEKEKKGRDTLTNAGIGLGIQIGVLILPTLIDKMFAVIDMGFSSCVTPF